MPDKATGGPKVYQSFNPSNGIGVVHALSVGAGIEIVEEFQSLKRDRGGSCNFRNLNIGCFIEFQSLKRDRGGSCSESESE